MRCLTKLDLKQRRRACLKTINSLSLTTPTLSTDGGRHYFWGLLLELNRFSNPVAAMGAIHKMAATLGDSPTARALRGNFSSQRSLPHQAKHVSLGFLFLLRVNKPHTNENLSGSTPPFRHNADFCFPRAKISDKGLRELLRPASVGNL